MTTRRRFIALIPATGAVFAAACSKQDTPPAAAPEAAPAPAPAAAPPAPEPAAPAAPVAAGPMLDEADAAAVALGYVADSARADQAKYPNHASTQACENCALYQGVAGAEAGPCPLFAGKQVSTKGWCASYAKKAA